MRNELRKVATIDDMRKKAGRAMRVLQVAALAAMLILLGAAASEAATIQCLSNGPTGGSNSCSLGYSPEGDHSNTWLFYRTVNFGDTQAIVLLYSLTISGTPTVEFALNVGDFVTPTYSFDYLPLAGTNQSSTLTCVPMFDANNCAFFNVTPVPGPVAPNWLDGVYDVSIVWNVVPPGTLVDPENPRITILKTESTSYDFSNATMLSDIRYAPYLTLPDPGIGGRGNEFSTFGVFAGEGLDPARVVNTKEDLLVTVPEPASLLLLGAGLAGLAVRARRRKT